VPQALSFETPAFNISEVLDFARRMQLQVMQDS